MERARESDVSGFHSGFREGRASFPGDEDDDRIDERDGADLEENEPAFQKDEDNDRMDEKDGTDLDYMTAYEEDRQEAELGVSEKDGKDLRDNGSASQDDEAGAAIGKRGLNRSRKGWGICRRRDRSRKEQSTRTFWA